ncbi:hypothetical protein PMAYCL1PPCAC_25735, partial [Pristionchus mayeri]
HFPFSNMYNKYPCFTRRICCCSAMISSQVFACISMIFSVFAAVMTWYYNVELWIKIVLTMFIVTEIFA